MHVIGLMLEGYGENETFESAPKIRVMLDQFETRGWADSHGKNLSYQDWVARFSAGDALERELRRLEERKRNGQQVWT